MKRIKLFIIGIMIFLISFHLKNMDTFSKEIKLPSKDIGKFYKEYILTKIETGVKLKDYFNDKEIIIKNKDVKNIIDIMEDKIIYETLEDICMESLEIKKQIKGSIISKTGENYIFQRDDKYGVLDNNLNILVEPIYERLLKKEESELFLAKKYGKYGYINIQGEEIIPFEFEIGALETSGLMVVKKYGKVGLINSRNEIVIDFKYDGIYFDKNNFIGIKDNEYFSIKMNKEREKIDVTWMGVQKSEKIFYEKNGKFGIFDLENRYITDNIYDQLSQNYNQLIIAMKSGKYGLIDNKGKEKIPFNKDFILPVGANFFKAGSDEIGLFFLINQNGKILTKEKYDDFIPLSDRYVIGIVNDEIFLVNKIGKKIKKIDSIVNFNNKMLLYKKNGENILKKL